MNIQPVHQLGVDRYNIRKPDRVRIELTTRLRLTERPDIEISVRNISNRGFMAETAEDVPIGQDALVYLPGIGWTLAQICWCIGNRFGGRFSEALNMRQFWRANPPKRVINPETEELTA